MYVAVVLLLVVAGLVSGAALADDYRSPLQQLRDGTDPRAVECRENLSLVVRPPSDAACIRPPSVDAMSERGWDLVTDSGADTAVSGAYSPGPYAVGAVTNFVKDYDRPFDAWGAKYKSDEYRRLLERIDASGQPSTVPTMIYYPSAPDGRTVERAAEFHPQPLLAAADGTRQTVLDLYLGNEALAGQNPLGHDISYAYQSYMGATPAGDSFPLVVMIHGLGGGLMTWNQAAENLASQGYVVVTLAYSSDSGDTPVFEEPGSEFAGSVDGQELAGAYGLRAQETGQRLFANFLGMLYGYEGGISPGAMPDPSTFTARQGGGMEAGMMMGDLFEQRTEDLGAVIRTMTSLNAPEAECLEQIGAAGDLCGLLEGAIDTENIGVMGHSLGSMTAQSALVFIPEVDTAIAFNNGMPKRWEPFGGFPDAGLDPPAGVPKDILFVIGSDDSFVHMVFREIHMRWFVMAGGDINETYPLAAEQLWPTSDNPQPVALSAYERAQKSKALVVFQDQGHGNSADDTPGYDTPGSEMSGTRVPLDPEAQPERYRALGWVSDGGGDIFLPHQMRNYFMTAWFDWQLKGDDSGPSKITDHPFEAGVKSVRSDLP